MHFSGISQVLIAFDNLDSCIWSCIGCGGGDPVGVGHDHLIAWPNAQCMHAHLQRTSAAAGGEGVVHAQVGLECLLEANDVIVAVLAPSIGRRVGGVLHLKFGDRRLGVWDFADLAAAHLNVHHSNVAAVESLSPVQCLVVAVAAPR